jgi:hypothetical protein
MSALKKTQRIFLLILLIPLITILIKDKVMSQNILKNSCQTEKEATLVKTLSQYPLFDTSYKLAANYSPVLLLRALAESNIYKKKGIAYIKREFFIKNLSGKLGGAFEIWDLELRVEAMGLLGRKLIATGKINQLDLYYENKITGKLNNTASMDIRAYLEGCEFLKLNVESKKSDETNLVKGLFFGKTVDYKTVWRNTEGVLANLPYKIYVEGTNEDTFKLLSTGKIDAYNISGKGEKVSENKYLMEEYYGPLYIKTELLVELAR